MATKTGGCLCGTVRFTARDVPETFGICHCEMCRRWAGSALVGVSIPTDRVSWSNQGQIATLQSSDWAERAWCRRCGSGLYYRVTAEGAESPKTEIPLGLFDDPDGFTLLDEIWIDEKPDGLNFADVGHKKLTRAECVSNSPDWMTAGAHNG